MGINQHKCWELINSKLSKHKRAIKTGLRPWYLALVYESLRGAGLTLSVVNIEDLESQRMEFCVSRLLGRQIDDTRKTPCRPKINQSVSRVQIGESVLITVEVGIHKIRKFCPLHELESMSPLALGNRWIGRTRKTVFRLGNCCN